MRRYRADNPLVGEARKRSNARAFAHVYVKRGKLKKKPCEFCGDPVVEIHIPDYDKPLEIVWLCVKCRRGHLKSKRSSGKSLANP
jgi:hypothetical protein